MGKRSAASRWHTPLRAPAIGALLVLAGLAVVMVRDVNLLGWLERSLLYFPSHEVAYPLSAFGPAAEEVWFGDDARLHGIFVPGPNGQKDQATTVIFFHGNGGNLTDRAPLLARLRAELRVNAFIFDYQGYGQSGGSPSEAATAADARAAIKYLGARSDVDMTRLVFYGESLGGAVAIELASAHPPLGLVVQSSFTSISAMTELHYPALGFLLPYATTRYDSLAAIRTVAAPIMLVHSTSDTVVPIAHSQQLRGAAGGPARLWEVPDAGHNDVHVRGGPELWQALRDFLTGLDPLIP